MARSQKPRVQPDVRRQGKRVERRTPHQGQSADPTGLHPVQADPRAEEPLREAEQRFRAIFDATSDGIFLHDLETWKLTMGNRACLQMLGYTEEEFANLSVCDLHPAADLPFIQAQIGQFLHGGAPQRHDIRFHRKDGSILFADVSPDLVRLEGKRYVLVAMKDITERKRVEETLAESERKYRSLVENIPDVTWTTDRQGRTLFISPNVRDVYGYSPEEIYDGGDTWLGRVHPEDRPRVEEAFRELFTRNKRYNVEYRIRRKEGNWIWLHDRSVSSYEKEGQWYADGVFSDVTERKHLEEELRRHAERLGELVAARTGELQESEARYRSLYHTVADGIFVVGVEGRIENVNDSACAQLGYTRAELIGTPVAAISARSDFRVEEIFDRLRAAGRLSFETTHRRKDGVIVPVELSLALVEYRGRPAILGVARDITERKRAEEALRASEERHRRLIENLKGSHFIYRHDTKGVFQYLSESLTGVLGYAPQEFLTHYGKYLTDHPANQAVHRHTELTLQGIQQPPYEINIWHKDGSTRWLEVQEVPVFDPEGQVVAVEGVAQDITERKRAEEVLREKEHLLSESQRIGHIGTWSVDLATHAVTWTSETYRLFGVSPETFVPSAATMIDLLDADDRRAMREWIRAASAGEHPAILEFRVVLPDGSVRVLSGRGEIMGAGGNRPLRFVGTVQDVTEQKRAQAALQESEERYRILLEHGFDGIFVHEDFRIVQLNDRLAEMAGYPRAELLDARAIDLFTPDSQERIRRYIRSGAGDCYEVELRRRDGRVVDVESYGAPCTFQGRRARIVGLRDITERKRAHEAQRRLNEQLEKQVAQRTEDLRHTVRRLRELTLELSQAEDRERQRIAGILHEDLQQTLAAARFHLNLLGSEPRGPVESQEIVEQVKQMLKDAIAKSRNLSHELSPAIYQVELTEILAWLARHMEQEYGLRVHVEAAGRADSSSEPLKALLYKVVQELLFNVVKHAHVNEAGIRVRRRGRYLCLAVIDRGCGFEPQGLREAAGFGLLGIRERIQLLGGRMKIRSAPGAGSRVLIVVPEEGPAPIAALLAHANGPKPAPDGGIEGSIGVR